MNIWLAFSVFGNIMLLLLCFAMTRLYRMVADELYDRKNIDMVLDTVFRTFHLHTEDPYVTLTGYDDEKRCYHCRFPFRHGHDQTCIWVKFAPARKYFYKNT